MKYTIKNNTGQDTSTLNKMVDAYFPYAQKNMGFDMSVTIMFESDMENAKNPLGKTAYYDPSNYTVVLYTDNRHPKDIMRSLSHELVHHKQNCNGELSGITGEQGYAQTGVGSRIEEEAYSLGNTCFRNWEDSLKKQINETSYSRKDGKMKLTKELINKHIKEVLKEGFLDSLGDFLAGVDKLPAGPYGADENQKSTRLKLLKRFEKASGQELNIDSFEYSLDWRNEIKKELEANPDNKEVARRLKSRENYIMKMYPKEIAATSPGLMSAIAAVHSGARPINEKDIKENNIMNLTKNDIEELVKEAVKNIAIKRTQMPLESTEAISEEEGDLEEGKPKPDDPRDVIKKKIRTGEGEEDKSWEAPLKNVSRIEEGKPWDCPEGQVRSDETGDCEDDPGAKPGFVPNGDPDEPLKEWYDNSLYNKLIKDYTRSKK